MKKTRQFFRSNDERPIFCLLILQFPGCQSMDLVPVAYFIYGHFTYCTLNSISSCDRYTMKSSLFKDLTPFHFP